MTWSYCFHRRYSMSRQKNSILINEHSLNREPVPWKHQVKQAEMVAMETRRHSHLDNFPNMLLCTFCVWTPPYFPVTFFPESAVYYYSQYLTIEPFFKIIKLTKHKHLRTCVRVKISFVFTARAVNTSRNHCYNLQTWWQVQYDRNIWRWQVTSFRSEENLRGNILITLYIFTLTKRIILLTSLIYTSLAQSWIHDHRDVKKYQLSIK